MDPRTDPRVRQAYFTLVIVCSAVGIVILLIGGLALALAPAAYPGSGPSTGVLATFLVIGAGCVAAALGVRRRAVAAALNPEQRGRTTPETARDMADVAIARIRMGVIAACAFSEIPAMLGFAYVVIGGDPVWAVPFFGGAVVTWALVFPRPSEWEEWLSGIALMGNG